MTQNQYRQLLLETVDELNKAADWLKHSFDICRHFDIAAKLSVEQYDDLEALSSRFARVSDMLVQKAFRAIDRITFEEGGTLIDAINRAEKRGLVDSLETVRKIREIRNEIAHEYSVEDLVHLLRKIIDETPTLLSIVESIKNYAAKYEQG